MNGVIRGSVLAFILVLAFSLCVWAADQPEPRLITVAGDAEVKVVPDEVILTFGVQTMEKDLEEAKNENDARTKKILALAEKYNIEPKHIQTDHINIEPRYRHRYEQRDFVGYSVRKTIVFTLKDTSKFEDLLSSVLEAGANYVYGVRFRTTELRKYRDQARALAIKAAQAKARDLAKELGQTIGKPHMIHEERADWWYNSWWGGRRAQNVIQNIGGAAAESESSIALGQVSVNAKVTVSFELEE